MWRKGCFSVLLAIAGMGLAVAQDQPPQVVEVMRVPQEILDDLRENAGAFQAAAQSARDQMQIDRGAQARIQQQFVALADDYAIAMAAQILFPVAHYPANEPGRQDWRRDWWPVILQIRDALDLWNAVFGTQPAVGVPRLDAGQAHLSRKRLIEHSFYSEVARSFEYFAGGHLANYEWFTTAQDPRVAAQRALAVYGEQLLFWSDYALKAAAGLPSPRQWPAHQLARIDQGPQRRAMLRDPSGVLFVELSREEMLQAREEMFRFGWAWNRSALGYLGSDDFPAGQFIQQYDGRYDAWIDLHIIPAFAILTTNLRYLIQTTYDTPQRTATHRWIYESFFFNNVCLGDYGTLARECAYDFSLYDTEITDRRQSQAFRHTNARLRAAHEAYLLKVSDLYVSSRWDDAYAAAKYYSDTARRMEGQGFDGWTDGIMSISRDKTDTRGWAPRHMLTPKMLEVNRQRAALQRKRRQEQQQMDNALMLIGGTLLAGVFVPMLSPGGVGLPPDQDYAQQAIDRHRDYYNKPVNVFGFTQSDLVWGRSTPSGGYVP